MNVFVWRNIPTKQIHSLFMCLLSSTPFNVNPVFRLGMWQPCVRVSVMSMCYLLSTTHNFPTHTDVWKAKHLFFIINLSCDDFYFHPPPSSSSSPSSIVDGIFSYVCDAIVMYVCISKVTDAHCGIILYWIIYLDKNHLFSLLHKQ